MSEINNTPAPAQTPAPNSAPEAGQTPAPAPTSANWYDGFNDEIKGYVQAKGFKDAGAVVESYRNIEKLMGVPKDRLLKLPEKADDPAWNDIHYKLGKPEKAESYKVELPKDYGDENFAKAAKDMFHKANLTMAQAEEITKWWNGHMEAHLNAEREAIAAEIQRETEALKKEWGAAFEQNFNAMDTVIEKFGISEGQLLKMKDTFGAAGAAKFLYNLSSKLGEHTFTAPGGPNSTGTYSPTMAKEAIKERMKDVDFRQRLLNGDAQAKAEWDKLNRNAVGQK